MNGLVGNKSRSFVSLILLVLIAWLLGHVAWMFFDSTKQELSLPELNQAVPEKVAKQAVTPVYLFGKKASVAEKEAVVEQEEFKQSKLNLKLMGVLMAPTMSVAIINKAGQSNSYAEEEEIQRGVVLKEVHAEFVLISNRGLLEKLEMTKTDSLFSQGAVAQPLSETQMSKLAAVKENALKTPVSIMRYVRFQNILKNGKIASVKVWPRQEKEIFTALGFVAGDELLSIDGHSIDKLSKSSALWQSLLKQSQFELTVKRNGQEMPLSVGLE